MATKNGTSKTEVLASKPIQGNLASQFRGILDENLMAVEKNG